MGPAHKPLGKVGAAIISTVVASLAIAGPVGATEHDGSVTVSGESVSSIQLALSDDTAQFGTNLNPDGTVSNSLDIVAENVDGSSPSTGTCYEWDGAVTINSNVTYDVTVSSTTENTILDFLTSNPADFAACTSGEAVDDTPVMFSGTTPPGEWATGTATASADHDYWLGLDVQWSAAPSTTLANATLTLSAVAAS